MREISTLQAESAAANRVSSNKCSFEEHAEFAGR